MRFVAGRGAVAKRLDALWRIAIGKKLVGAPWWLSCCWLEDATEQDAAGRGALEEMLAGCTVVDL